VAPGSYASAPSNAPYDSPAAPYDAPYDASDGIQPGGCARAGAAGQGWRACAPGTTGMGSLVTASQPA